MARKWLAARAVGLADLRAGAHGVLAVVTRPGLVDGGWGEYHRVRVGDVGAAVLTLRHGHSPDGSSSSEKDWLPHSGQLAVEPGSESKRRNKFGAPHSSPYQGPASGIASPPSTVGVGDLP